MAVEATDGLFCCEAKTACEVKAFISTELATAAAEAAEATEAATGLLLVIRKSCTLSNLQTSEDVFESVEETEPSGLRLEDVSSSEVEEWVSPPLELWGLPFPVDSRSK